MAKTPKPVVFINRKEFAEKFKGIHVETADDELGKANLGAVIQFLQEDGNKDWSDVYRALTTLREKRKELPVFVLDEKFRPEHSKQLWLHRNVVGYLPLDQGETIWDEILGYFKDRLRMLMGLGKGEDVYQVGWSVQIEPEVYEKFNFVSLFIGRMRRFIVDLKLFLDLLKPEKPLGPNPHKLGLDLPRLMEFEWARRCGTRTFRCSLDGKTYGKASLDDELKASDEIKLFHEGKPAFTQGHILIQGETGTGKTAIADFVHEYLSGDFANDPNLGEKNRITCTNIGENIFENELFGSVKGYFTDGVTQPGAILMSYNGTVFLDEIGELSLSTQKKLLQYLDDRTIRPTGWLGDPIFVPAVVVAATNRDLNKAVNEMTFRADLLHRFGFSITIPPLRERKGDMERLVDFVLQNPRINPVGRVGHSKRRLVVGIEKKAVAALKKYDFPGNFRELERFLREAAITTRSIGVDVITAGSVSEIINRARAQRLPSPPGSRPRTRRVSTDAPSE